LLSLVQNGQIKNIIIAHKDRFIRFGFEWFEKFCNNYGCNILIINDEKLSPQQEMINDLISIIHVFSCRIYGLRKYKEEIKKCK
jgi:putative resolvase